MLVLTRHVRSFIKQTKLFDCVCMEIDCNNTLNKQCKRSILYKSRKILSKKVRGVQTKKMKSEEARNNNIMDGVSSQVNNILQNFENITVLPTPNKSFSDTKNYLAIELGNGLRILFISDVKHLLIESDLINTVLSDNTEDIENIEIESEAKRVSDDDFDDEDDDDDSGSFSGSDEAEKDEKLAACALTVSVGSFSDPDEIPGLAHFLEHMVFMGSKKYHKENEFDSYISTRGGSDNASTECEYTSFYFECPEIHLEGALDRFSNFFISPLMSRDSISREIEAIESEFKLNLSSDTSRIDQIFCGTAPLNNPAHKFMWGNLVTLQQNVNVDELYNALQAFRERHYSAHRMTVAIQARLPMEVLLKWGITYFSNIPSNFLPPFEFPYSDPPFNMDLFAKLYTIEPVKDINKLLITWAMPSVLKFYSSKPLTYISYLIGNEGEGSLMAYLQEKLWALNVTAGNDDYGIENNSMYSLFSIDIALTEEGISNIEHVLQLVFSYIKLLHNTGPNERILKEIQTIEEINFRFQDESEAIDLVEVLSQNMHLYPPECYLNGGQLIFEYNPQVIRDVLSYLTPGKVNIILASKIASSQVILDQIEPWFSTKYCFKDIPQEWVNQWINCEPNPYFSLPTPNQYVAHNFELFTSVETIEFPIQLIQDKWLEAWYKHDKKFQLPIGYIKLYMISPIATVLPENSVMSELFITLFILTVGKELYPATVAGLNYKLSLGDHGLLLTVDGYNEKLFLLLETLLKQMRSFGNNISNGLFETAKEELRKRYHNKTLKASSLATELRLSILTKPYWTSITKINTLPSITLERLKLFVGSLFQELFVKCLIQGNISKAQATSISDSILELINYKPILKETIPMIHVRKLHMGEKILRVQSFNLKDPNCNVSNYYQCGLKSIINSCKLDMIMMLIEEPLFDQLRTQEQLGYDISCESRVTNGVLGFTITIKSQADKFEVQYVEERITQFLDAMIKDIGKMTVSAFNQVRDSLKLLKQQADTDLKAEVQRNWSEIITGDYVFDRNKREARCIENFKRNDILNFFCQLLNNSRKRNRNSNNLDRSICLRKLSFQVDSENPSSFDNSEYIQANKIKESCTNIDQEELKLTIKVAEDPNLQEKFIHDIEVYKNCLYMYPTVKLKMK